MLCLSYLLCFLFNKIGEAMRVGGGGGVRAVGRDDPKMYTHMKKCIKN
jgi:hypothetical protein